MATPEPSPTGPPSAGQPPAPEAGCRATTAIVAFERAAGELAIRGDGQDVEPAAVVRLIEERDRYAIGASGLARPRLDLGDGTISLRYEVGPPLVEPDAPRPLDPARLGDSLARVAGALAHLHAQGIAHGHLRLEVLCLGDRALAGFGVAALLERVARGRATTALPVALRAPELATVAPTPESDVFALGALVHGLAGAKRGARPDHAAALSALQRWAECAMAQDPADRPAVRSLVDLARTLARDAHAGVAMDTPVPTLANDGGPPPRRSAPEPARAVRRNVRWARPLSEPSDVEPVSRRGSPAARPWGVLLALALGVALMAGTVVLVFYLGWRRGGAASVPAPPPGGSVVTPAAPASTGAAIPPAPSALPVPSMRLPSPAYGAPALPAEARAEPSAPTDAPLPAAHATAVMPIDPESPSLGDPRSLVTVVIFGDPASARSLAVLSTLERAATSIGDVRLVWRHVSHDLAGARAARVATAIRRGHGAPAFFAYLAAVARGGGAPSDEALVLASTAVHVEAHEVRRWLDASEPMAEIERDRTLGVLFGVRETPMLFVNGRRVAGDQPAARLEALIREERRKAAVRLADGVSPENIYPDRAARNLIRLGEEVRLARCPIISRAPWRGAARPLVTVAEFTDFECGLCADLAPAIDRLVRPGGDVRHVHLDFPLHQHPHAQRAAVFAREVYAAHGAEVFFRLSAALRRATAPLDDAGLTAVASALGLDGAALLARARQGEHAPDVAANVEEAQRLGVRGLPTVYVNARRLDGVRSPADLATVVAHERARAARLVAAGVDPGRVWELLCGGE